MEQIRVQKLLDGFKNGTASLEVSTHTKETQTEATLILEPKKFAEKSAQTEEVATDYSRFFKETLDNLKNLNNKVENNCKLLEKLVPQKQFSFNNDNLFDDYSFNNDNEVPASPTSNPPVMNPINTPPFIDSLQEVLSLLPSQNFNINSTSSVPPPSNPTTSLPPPSSNPATSPPPPSQNLEPATTFLPQTESLNPATSLPPTSENLIHATSFYPPSQNLHPTTTFLPRSENLNPATSLPPTSENLNPATRFHPPSQNLYSTTSFPPRSQNLNPATSLPPTSENLDPTISFCPPSQNLYPATSFHPPSQSLNFPPSASVKFSPLQVPQARNQNFDEMYRQSSSIGNFAKNIAFNLFSRNEMEGANCAGLRGKRALEQDPRMDIVKETVFKKYSVEDKKKGWALCRKAIDSAIRHLK